MSGKIEAEKVLFKDIFSEDFWFVIPVYQRSYVWQKDNIAELIDDLKYAYENKPTSDYFLGSLVLKKLNNDQFPEYDVLDGQQRLTTFFLMMAVIRDMITDADAKESTQDSIYQKGNKTKHIPSRVRIKYQIRDNIEGLIENLIIKENGTLNDKQLEKYQNSSISAKNMIAAIRYMKEVFSSFSDLEGFVEFIFNNALFIYVSTDNSEDAFRMFTILNDRGIPLTNADILKSDNIGALKNEFPSYTPQQLHNYETKYATEWEQIEDKFDDRFDRFLQFVRAIYIKDKARTNLLDEFKEKIYKPNLLRKGTDTFKSIKEYSDIYSNIIDLQDSSLPIAYKNLITIMLIGMRSDDWIPPVLYFSKKFGNHKIYEFLRKLEYKFTADWVCGITPTLRLDAMNTILKAIEQASNATEVINNCNLYSFNLLDYEANLNQDIYTKRYAKMLLLKLEFLQSDNTAQISDYGTISVEHVLPQNPATSSQWFKDFSPDDHNAWVHKIANLVLISRKKNSSLSNLDFMDKKSKYLALNMDIFKTNKVFIETQSTWDIPLLQARQNTMIKLLIEN